MNVKNNRSPDGSICTLYVPPICHFSWLRIGCPKNAITLRCFLAISYCTTGTPALVALPWAPGAKYRYFSSGLSTITAV